MSNDDEHWGGGKTVIVQSTPTADRSLGVLTVVVGAQPGKVLRLPDQGLTTLGRGPEQNFRFDDQSVSGQHAQIVHIGGQFMLADMKSTNGSFINDQRLADPVQLRDGDRVQLGRQTVLRFSLVTHEEEEALQRAFEAALRDGLTGALNRRHLEERLDAEISFAIRHKTELSVVMLDVDYFKRVNDSLGHPAGDAVLRHTAQLLQRTIRNEDTLARYGGEEFTVIVRGIDLNWTAAMAERLRVMVEQTPVPWQQQMIQITASFGVSSLVCCGTQRDRNTLIAIADRRLYLAKQGGRNRVAFQG